MKEKNHTIKFLFINKPQKTTTLVCVSHSAEGSKKEFKRKIQQHLCNNILYKEITILKEEERDKEYRG